MDKVPIGFGYLQRIDARESGGVIHQSIEAAADPLDRGKHLFNLGDPLQIGAKQRRVAAFRSRSARLVLRAMIMNRDR